MEKIKTYGELKAALLDLCDCEGLKFVETKLNDPKIVFFRFDDGVVLNTGTEFGKREMEAISV